MTSAIIAAVMPDASDREARLVRGLTWNDRGRLAAVETPAGLFYGFLGSMIFHEWGDVHLYFERDGFKTDVSLKPDHLIYLHLDVRKDLS